MMYNLNFFQCFIGGSSKWIKQTKKLQTEKVLKEYRFEKKK